MHLWINPSILKIKTPSIGSFRGKRPKSITNEEWNALVADAVLNRQLNLNTVPKPSKKERTTNR